MTMQWCLPLVQGRGAGLGNELIPWARAYLMAHVLGARCLYPAFSLNPRNYRIHFQTSRLDFFRQKLLVRALPRVHFDESDFETHGGTDTVSAFTAFAHSHGLFQRRPLLVTTDGMWGGLQHVDRARDFIRGKLYNTRFAASNLAVLGARLHPNKLTVALHVRLGDFSPAASDPNSYRGKFNCALPLEWFLKIGRQLISAFGSQLQFQIFSDGSPAQLEPLTKLLNPVDSRSPRPSDASDLLAMAKADLLVCSVSSYSVWAATLSTSPYIWFGPQMHTHGAEWASIWGDQDSQRRDNSATLTALSAQVHHISGEQAGRAYIVGIDGHVPASLVQTLQRRSSELDRIGDLVRCGVARHTLC